MSAVGDRCSQDTHDTMGNAKEQGYARKQTVQKTGIDRVGCQWGVGGAESRKCTLECMWQEADRCGAVRELFLTCPPPDWCVRTLEKLSTTACAHKNSHDVRFAGRQATDSQATYLGRSSRSGPITIYLTLQEGREADWIGQDGPRHPPADRADGIVRAGIGLGPQM